MKNTYFHLTEQSFEFPQNGFELKNGFLTFHNVSLEHLIKKHGTPFRLFYLPNIAEKIKQARDLFNKAFKKHHYLGKYQYCYCTKSNHFSHTVSAALKENIHLETSSSFDIDLILNLYKEGKVTKDIIVINNGYKTEEYLKKILSLCEVGFKNVIVVLDNQPELERLNHLLKDN